jgi:8-oxo-dGTP pyrophosphatase MutT (NUDIX family)
MIIERYSIRAILLSPEEEVLLLRIRPPDGSDCFWITPGGGLEPAEDAATGLRRELREELGLEDFEIGPLVWRRQHTFTWAGNRICQQEEYHVVHVDRFEPRMSDALEMQIVDRFRWWPVGELAETSERLTPLSLAEILSRYLTHGPPAEVTDVEVISD